MASIRARKETGLLFFDFRFRGQRCRAQTMLQDTPANRMRLEKALARIEADIAAGTFDYAATFPGSRNIPARDPEPVPAAPPGTPTLPTSASAAAASAAASPTPTFNDFTAIWLSEHQIEWRRSHIKVLKCTLDGHLLPHFGDRPVGKRHGFEGQELRVYSRCRRAGNCTCC